MARKIQGGRLLLGRAKASEAAFQVLKLSTSVCQLQCHKAVDKLLARLGAKCLGIAVLLTSYVKLLFYGTVQGVVGEAQNGAAPRFY